ncbi:MAG: 2,3-bisphosphoglycerate-independent phosphoglycerate mutase [candidate division WOR-3 bacterium]
MNLIENLAQPNDKKILLVVLDGLGGIPRNGKTELETAWKPNLDRLAAKSGIGLLLPVAPGVTPGSGPAHLALFGYNPIEYRVGRGVLEAMGVGLDVGENDLCARANFATIGPDGIIVDRRAKENGERMKTELCVQLCENLQHEIRLIEDVEVLIRPGKEHRFAVVFRGPGLAPGLSDSDPGDEGLPPKTVKEQVPAAAKSSRIANIFIERCAAILGKRKQANFVLLRGLALPPKIPSMQERYKLNPACIATYPMYRGLARLVGMTVLDTGDSWESELETLCQHYSRFDFFFLHIKELDRAGEDGDFDRKVELIEEFDEEIVPQLVNLNFDVLAITGDHSTPALLRAHSWHSVPFLLYSPYVRPQVQVEEFGERACVRGNIGYLSACDLMPLLLAHALKLRKFGA